MKLNSQSFAHDAPIPGEFAFAVIDPVAHIALSKNRNPHLAWSDAPAGTRSFALICHDSDVPSRGDDVNQEGKEVPASLPRVDFTHWILIDIPPAWRQIEAGSFSEGVVAHGKPGPAAPHGTRQGINDYTGWFASDPNMRGEYYGYDGPCPPWNDVLLHHYHFTLYALDVPRLEVSGPVNAPAVKAQLASHALDQAVLTGTYTLNPRVRRAG
jgi:Raf kinase inhibitor-like YbhB/YbcL family protein